MRDIFYDGEIEFVLPIARVCFLELVGLGLASNCSDDGVSRKMLEKLLELAEADIPLFE